MSASMFICPVCGEVLYKEEKAYVCGKHHSFDIARKGYVNLLLSQAGGQHGDDRAMIAARTDFLNRGFYNPLSEEICRLAAENTGENERILDAGCGECKYTADISRNMRESGRKADIIGIDISKEALGAGRRYGEDLKLAVASTADMPIESGSIDVLVNIFAPFSAKEFARVLKPHGIVIRAYPLARHLWELKELIYEKPYENPETDMEEPPLTVAERHEVKFKMSFTSCEEVKSLFQMTPYFYRTGDEDRRKIEKISSLICSAEFGIVIYKKQK